ncbi:MAG: paraquat-inducible protein A, partial [Candidatus Competibacterales bacterium]
MSPPPGLTSCRFCNKVQALPPGPGRGRLLCHHCGAPLKTPKPHGNIWTATLALGALACYPPAILLPILRVERLGQTHEDSLLSGIGALLSQGDWWVGLLVFLCSLVLPPLKLIALVGLSLGGVTKPHHRVGLYRLTEVLGRWGMLDVMLVALLVAFVKLGDVVTIHTGAGLLAFAAMVVLSLMASLVFDPHPH